MTASYPRLLGDIGGTNARWAWQPAAGSPPQDLRVPPCAESPTIAACAQSYSAETGHAWPTKAGIGTATPLTCDAARMTNHPWAFSIEALRREPGAARCLVPTTSPRWR